MPVTTTDPGRHHWVTRGDGGALHALRWGDGPVATVGLHGVTSCGWVWHHVARHLLAGGAFLAPDLRGQGASSWAAPDRYRTIDHAGDIGVLLDALAGSGLVDLVGSSWGALIALAVAAERPADVRRLVLVDIEPSFGLPPDVIPSRPTAFASLEAAQAWWAEGQPHAPSDLLAIVAAGATRPAPGGGWAPAHDPLFARLWPFRAEDWWATLDEVKVPTLVVTAGQSWVRAEVGDEMAAHLSVAERLHLPDSTHVVPVDAPDDLGRALHGFLGAGAS